MKRDYSFLPLSVYFIFINLIIRIEKEKREAQIKSSH